MGIGAVFATCNFAPVERSPCSRDTANPKAICRDLSARFSQLVKKKNIRDWFSCKSKKKSVESRVDSFPRILSMLLLLLPAAEAKQLTWSYKSSHGLTDAMSWRRSRAKPVLALQGRSFAFARETTIRYHRWMHLYHVDKKKLCYNSNYI